MKRATITEGLEYKDCVGMMKPTVYVDAFVSKVGQDDAYVVLSFLVNGVNVAADLVGWFEGGYPYVVDADSSPGEIAPNRYLVFVELKRRTQVLEQIREMCNDLETLTEFTLADWTVVYQDNEYRFDDMAAMADALILSPHRYREAHETDLNEMRTAANLPVKPIYNTKKDHEINLVRQRAGLL